MKKIVLIIALSLFAIKANSQDTNIVYNPLDTNCCTYWSATVGTGGCRPYISNLWNTCMLKQQMENIYFAQPYYMDSVVKVVGVRAYITSANNYRPGYYMKLMDVSFNVLDSLDYLYGNSSFHHSFKDFYFKDTTSIQSFYLTATFPYNDIQDIIFFNFSLSSIDSNNYIYGCNTGHEPWIIDEGMPRAFSEDSCFKHYKNTHLYFFPILLVKKTSSLDNGLDLDKYTNIFPNPAKDNINITCSFIIEELEILDIMGRKVIEEEVKDYSKTINTQNFIKGIYIAKIKTQQGTTTKKFSVE